MKTETTIGIDIGLSGGISINGTTYLTPITKHIVKEAVYVFDLKNNKKQYYKSGPNKGNPKKKIKSAAKYRTELDIKAIANLFTTNKASTVILEKPGNSIGNSARSTASVFFNFGKLYALAELLCSKVVVVPAHKWKKDLNLSKDKLECVEYAEKLSGKSFRTKRGSLIDGPAEAYLIEYWYRTTNL